VPEPDRPPPLTLLDRARGVVAAGATPARAGPCDGRCGCCGGLELELVLPPPPGGGEVGRRLSAPAAGDGRSCGPGIAQNDRLEGDKGRVQWRSTRSGSNGLTRRVGGGGSSRALFSAPLSPGLSPASGPCPPLAFAVQPRARSAASRGSRSLMSYEASYSTLLVKRSQAGVPSSSSSCARA
jgi:hypothetical protein